MHPGMMHWWRTRARAADCGTESCHPMGGGWSARHERAWHARWAAPPDGGDAGANAFGVRRPLRFLAYKLGLSEAQVAELARILNDVKTERAQADVDARRALTAFADAVAGETFDADRATAGAGLRVQSAERLREVVLRALGQLHALLEPEQRARLAYLLRTGTIVM
jgi:Spy/CpxP family protein refolding chaperone